MNERNENEQVQKRHHNQENVQDELRAARVKFRGAKLQYENKICEDSRIFSQF